MLSLGRRFANFRYLGSPGQERAVLESFAESGGLQLPTPVVVGCVCDRVLNGPPPRAEAQEGLSTEMLPGRELRLVRRSEHR